MNYRQLLYNIYNYVQVSLWSVVGYQKFSKYLDTQKICWNHSKIWTMWLYHRVTSPNDADGITNSVVPDQTVWSGSALFAQAYLSENLGSLRYVQVSLWSVSVITIQTVLVPFSQSNQTGTNTHHIATITLRNKPCQNHKATLIISTAFCNVWVRYLSLL